VQGAQKRLTYANSEGNPQEAEEDLVQFYAEHLYQKHCFEELNK
jgi:hypothetical protein